MSPWLSVTFVGIGALIACANWYAFLSARRGERHGSPVPFLGGQLLFVGLVTLPAITRYAWLALVADYGTLAGVAGLFAIAAELWRTSPLRLEHRLVAGGEGRSCDVRLFEHDGDVAHRGERLRAGGSPRGSRPPHRRG